MLPLLHLLRSYLLILPSVSIRADCCHFRPVCPCISFLFSPSLSSTQFPLSFSIHLSPPGEQTAATTLTPARVGAVMLGGGGGVYTRKAFCSPAISRRGRRMSGRLEMPPHLIYCTQGMTTTPPCEVIFIKRNTSSALFSHVDLCLGKNWNYKEDSQGF